MPPGGDGPATRRVVGSKDGTARQGAGRGPGFVMAFVYLFLAGLLEIVWAVGLKFTEGFTRLVPSVITGTALVASMILLALALRDLPVGTGYAIWTGIGAVGTAIVGIALLGEPATVARLASIGLIVAGIVGLKLSH